jgi:hypothetical protein
MTYAFGADWQQLFDLTIVCTFFSFSFSLHLFLVFVLWTHSATDGRKPLFFTGLSPFVGAILVSSLSLRDADVSVM